MRLAVAALTLALAACARSPDLPPGGGWRRNFLELDQGLEHVFAACGLSQLRHMNLGDAENDGRGDSVQLALSTAAINLNYLANSGCLTKKPADGLTACATHFCSPEEAARDHSGNGAVSFPIEHKPRKDCLSGQPPLRFVECPPKPQAKP